jgi:hypothetical protein
MAYSFERVEYNYGALTEIWTCNFTNEDGIVKHVLIDLTDDEQSSVKIIEEESDMLTDEDRRYFYYILDRWLIQNLI